MIEAKRKKLEALKKANAAAKAKLANAPTTNPVIDISTSSSNSASENKISKLIEATTKAPADINLEEVRKATKRISRFGGDGMNITKMSDTYLGKNIETYDVEIQCELDAASQSDSEDENEIDAVKEKARGFRKSVMPTSMTKKTPIKKEANHVNQFGQMEDKSAVKNIAKNLDGKEEGSAKPYKAISEEMRRQILTSEELQDFMFMVL